MRRLRSFLRDFGVEYACLECLECAQAEVVGPRLRFLPHLTLFAVLRMFRLEDLIILGLACRPDLYHRQRRVVNWSSIEICVFTS